MARHPATKANQEPNKKLITARGRLRSPHHRDQPMSRAEMADAVNAALDALYPDRENISCFYVHDRWIGNLERGDHHWASAERRAALRQVTGAATDHELGLFKPRPAVRGVSARILTESDTGAEATEEMSRRTGHAGRSRSGRFTGELAPAWAALLGVAPAFGAAALSLEDLDRFHAVARDAGRYMDTAVVAFLGDCLDRCADDDGRHGPRHALPGVLGVAAVVQHTAREATSRVRRPLLAVGARAAEFAGWLYRDCGQTASADYWRDRASEWAMEIADFAMPGYVLIKKSQSAWDERDASRMLGLAQAVEQGPWRLPTRVLAEAVQQQARGLAMLNRNRQQVDDTLKKARGILEHGSPDGTPLAAHYDTALFAVQTAICYGESGRPEEAADIYESTLTPAVFSARDHAYFSTLRAQTLVAAHRPDDAATIGTGALAGAVAMGSARTVRELSRLCGRLEPWRSRPAVHEFIQLMGGV